jgi:hypothetical protein
MDQLIEGKDYYWDGPFMIFTRQYHLRRGHCCGSGCRHCPYEPRWRAGNTAVAREDAEREREERRLPRLNWERRLQ